MSWVGRSIRRFEDPALLRGSGRYTADLALASGAAAVRFVRSQVARGRVRSVSRPRGAAVFTAADLAGIEPIRSILHRPDYVVIAQPPLAAARVNHLGEALAVVVAQDAAAAEDLAGEVAVEIDSEDPVVDLDAALDPRSPRVHAEAAGNVIVDNVLRTPGLDGAFARAAAVVAVDVRGRRQNASPLEARAALAEYDAATGRVTLTCSAQMPHMLRTGLADFLRMPESDLRVIAPDVGGGFGQKIPLFPEYLVLVWLARKLRTSLAWIEDRHENLIASAHARDHHHLLRGAFDAEGRLLAIEGDLRCNVGAYSHYPFSGGIETLQGSSELPGPYDFEHYGVRSRAVLTNTCMMAPYRAVSRPLLTLAMERLMDKAAAHFRVDPVAIRRRNLVTRFPYVTPSAVQYDEGSYRAALDLAERHAGVPAFRERQLAARARGRHLGLGFAVFNEPSGKGSPNYAKRKMADLVPGFETVEMAMDPSGWVEARIGTSPHGQGLATSLAQIIADEVGVAPAKVRIVHGDTDEAPYGWGTFASRSLVLSGAASKLAAARLAGKLRAMAAALLEAAPADIELADGNARIKGSDRAVGIATLARDAFHRRSRFAGMADAELRTSATYDPTGTYSNGCHAVEVEVDVETGEVKILRYIVVEDAGLLVNPMIVDGQLHGGVAQGIANALYEELKYDESGNLLTATLADYLMPTAAEVPAIEIHHLQTLSEATLTRAKGMGEGGTIGAPAALLNAIVDALTPFGVELGEVPATPAKIRAALRSAGAR